MTATTQTIDSKAARQIAEKASNQRQAVEREQAQAQQRLIEAQQERARLSEAVQARLAQLNQAERNAAAARDLEQQAQRYAELAIDTLGAHAAIDAANKAEKVAA